MRGVISERIELDAHRVPPGRPVFLDTGDVRNINSLGVRNWIRLLDALCQKAPEVAIRRLSPVLVLQASMITTFLSQARVESFLVPWCCVQCDHMMDTVHAIDDELPATRKCPKCAGAMELDSDRDAYLAFRTIEPAGSRGASESPPG